MSKPCLPVAFVLGILGCSSSLTLSAASTPTKIAIRNVTFVRTGMLSPQEQDEIALKLKKRESGQTADLWGWAVQALQEVRTAYQDHGYFKVGVTAMLAPVLETGEGYQVDIRLSVIDDGRQYWLREVQFTHATAFPEQRLLSAMPIHAGEVFQRDKVDKGLEALRELYAASGYLNFASTAETEFDDVAGSISIHIDVDEGSQFQFRNLVLSKLNESKTQQAEHEWEQLKGRVYSSELLRSFYVKCFGPAPSGLDPLEYGGVHVDVAAHAVDIHLVFPSESSSGEVGP